MQQLLLRSVLAGDPLPGSGETVRLADLAFATRDGKVLLSDADLGGRPSVPGASTPIRIVTPASAAREAKDDQALAYLRFHPPQIDADGVWLMLSGEMAAPGGAGTMGLSSVRVKFRKVDGAWEAVGGPVASAN